MEKLQLTSEELNKIQEMNNEFTKAKMAIGDLEIQKSNILKRIESLRIEFSEQEALLINKYGQDAVINIQTGEVSKKQN